MRLNQKKIALISEDSINTEEKSDSSPMVIEQAINYLLGYNHSARPSVGICILSKDSYQLIKECIESIEKYVLYENTLLFVFDTGSTDTSVLDFYNQKRNNCKFPFSVIDVGTYHFSTNYNVGLQKVNTDYYLIQNNDTSAINDYVTKLLRLAILDKVGITGPRMYYADRRIQHDGQIIYDHLKKTFAHPAHVNLGKSYVAEQRVIVDGITGAGIFVSRKHYWELGGFNEQYKDIYQDVEFNIRSRMAGKIAVCDRGAQIYHYDNSSRKQFWTDISRVQGMQEDEAYMFAKYGKELRYTYRAKKDLSIIVLVDNHEKCLSFLLNLKSHLCDISFEIILLPNICNEYSSIGEALNIGVSIAESEYVVFCPQEQISNSLWSGFISRQIKELKSINGKIGVVSLIVKANRDNISKDSVCEETSTESGLFYLLRTASLIQFEEQVTISYNKLFTDLCLRYATAGYRNIVLDISENAPVFSIKDQNNLKWS